MDSEKFWDFVKDNLISLITIVAGFTVATLSGLGLVTDEIILPSMLGLLALLATSEIIEKTRKLNKIEKTTERGIETILQNIKGADIRTWLWTETDDYLRYLQKRLHEAHKSIDHAALSPRLPRDNDEMRKYNETLKTIVAQNKIRYRYIAALADPFRLDRVRDLVCNKNITRYFAGYFSLDPEKLPIISFSIIDEEELFLYFPSSYGELEAWVSIKNKEFAQVYTSYFRRIWEQCNKISIENFDDLGKFVPRPQKVGLDPEP